MPVTLCVAYIFTYFPTDAHQVIVYMAFERHICCLHMHLYVLWQAYYLGTYANNMKYMYPSVSGHIVDCSELFFRHIYQ